MRYFALLIFMAALPLRATPDTAVFNIPSTIYRLRIPIGFLPDETHSGPRMDFSAWHFTNAAGSKLSIVLNAHIDRTGTKTNFFGFAAKDQQQPMKRVLSLDSRGFTHEELEIAKLPVAYDLDLIYEAGNESDKANLDQAFKSFELQPRKIEKFEQSGPGYPPQGVGSPDP